jgi:hypothetical protein
VLTPPGRKKNYTAHAIIAVVSALAVFYTFRAGFGINASRGLWDKGAKGLLSLFQQGFAAVLGPQTLLFIVLGRRRGHRIRRCPRLDGGHGGGAHSAHEPTECRRLGLSVLIACTSDRLPAA